MRNDGAAGAPRAVLENLAPASGKVDRGDPNIHLFQDDFNEKLLAAGNGEVSFQCYHGPPNADRWIRLDDLRTPKLSE